MGEIFWEIYFGYGVSVRPPASLYRLSGWKWGGRTASGEGSVRAIFPDGKSRGSVVSVAILRFFW